MESQKEETLISMKANAWAVKIFKTHGLSAVLMLGGLWLLNGKLNNAESRIYALELRLYECYEKRIDVSGSKAPFSPGDSKSSDQLAVLPSDRKGKYSQTKTFQND